MSILWHITRTTRATDSAGLWAEPAVVSIALAPALAGADDDAPEDALTAVRVAELSAWAALLARSA